MRCINDISLKPIVKSSSNRWVTSRSEFMIAMMILFPHLLSALKASGALSGWGKLGLMFFEYISIWSQSLYYKKYLTSMQNVLFNIYGKKAVIRRQVARVRSPMKCHVWNQQLLFKLCLHHFFLSRLWAESSLMEFKSWQ